MKKDRLARSRWYPELALFESEEERKAVLKRFWRQLLRRKQYWLLVVAFSVGNTVVIACGSAFARQMFPGIPHFLVSTLIGGLAGAGVGLAIQYLWHKPCQRYLREQLNAKAVPICLDCGYDLRGQVVPRCPECGKAFDPALLATRGGMQSGHIADQQKPEQLTTS
jgi:hypothetical protein